jgi:hypothetical protein
MKKPISNLSISLIALTIIALVLGITVFQEVVYREITTDDGRYTAVVTYRGYEALLPAMPGQSGDKPGFISIHDSAGVQYGKIPIPMVSMANEFRWTHEGAELRLVGEWNFSSRTCRF